MMGAYFNREGESIPLREAMALFADDRYRQVARDHFGETLVSTVWLGINHCFGDGPPLIFETMTFDGALGEVCSRYSSEVEALEGHARILAAVQAYSPN